MTDRRTRIAATLIAGVMLLVAAACGQKPGVSGQLTAANGAALPEGATVNEQGQIVDSSGQVIGTAAGGLTGGSAIGGTSGGSGGTTTTTTTGGGTTSGSGPGSGGGTQNNGGGTDESGAPTGGSTTGVTNDTITIGIHAPLTGAAPVPSNSFDKGKDLYFRWMADHGQSIFGRGVKVIVKNDNYNPSQAVAVCKEMVEKDHVFLLVGGAGTDQIQACARYAASVGVPYLSPGVTEVGLTGLPNYFAVSMTYPQQGSLLADELVTKLGARSKKNGMLRFDTPNFQDAHDAWIDAMDKAGASVDYDRAVCKCAGSPDAQTVVQEMKTAGIENVYVLTSPVWWLQVLQAASQQSYHPQWVGVGITMTFDTVATVGCGSGNSMDGAKFFSPFPAWIDYDNFDKDFKAAYAKYYGDGKSDDFMGSLWNLDTGLAAFLSLPGKNLTRERFDYYLERAQHQRNGIGPELNFTPDDHLGANQVHVSEARCSDSRWHTIQSFVSDF